MSQQTPLGALTRGLAAGVVGNDKETLAADWSYHFVYGLTTAAAFRLLSPGGSWRGW